jgi:hypothetical protein
VFQIKQEKSPMTDALMVGPRLIQQSVRVAQENRPMADKGKGVMMCYAMSSSTCHATSPKLTLHDDVSCHINTHMPCHFSNCHVN